jgi:hypothetical protein
MSRTIGNIILIPLTIFVTLHTIVMVGDAIEDNTRENPDLLWLTNGLRAIWLIIWMFLVFLLYSINQTAR